MVQSLGWKPTTTRGDASFPDSNKEEACKWMKHSEGDINKCIPTHC